MDTIDFPEIEFMGKKIKPKGGAYRCPYACGDSRYPQPKYKTEKGFIKHLNSCRLNPELVKKRENEKLEQAKIMEEKINNIISKCNRKIGDKIFYVQEIITRPTHENRFGRMVRVRYEAEKIFRARESIIETIGSDGFSLVYNSEIRESEIKPTFADAQECADKNKKSYDEHVKFSQDCR